MAKAFGIVNFAGNHIAVEGMQEYRPVGAFIISTPRVVISRFFIPDSE